jgi:hypothetical protein
MKLQFCMLLLAVLIVAIVSMPKKSGKDLAEEQEKAEMEKGTGSAAPQTVIPRPDEVTVALVRPIRRELGRYSGTRPTDARVVSAAPFRGNVGEAVRGALGTQLTGEVFRIYGDGMLCPYFRYTLNGLGMMKAEEDPARRYMMEGSNEGVARAMQAAGYSDFVMNQEGVRTVLGHLVRQMLERQDKLVETGPRFSPMRASNDQASRLPAILDFHRWRVTVLPNLGEHGYVRITGIVALI